MSPRQAGSATDGATETDQPSDHRLAQPTPTRTVVRIGNVRLAYLLMLGSSLAFAAMGAFAHATNERCDWRFPALVRAALVFTFSFTLARLRGTRLVLIGPPTLWMRSFVGSAGILMTFFALTHLKNVATALTLTNTFPLWVTLLAWPVFGHRPTIGVVVALVSGIAGVVLIERPDQGGFHAASIAGLGAAVCTAVVMLGLHRLKYLDPVAIVVHFSAVATVIVSCLVVWTVLEGEPLDSSQLADSTTIALLIAIGALATTGQILMTAAFRIALPQRLSVVGLSQVLFGLGFDRLGWNRSPDAALLLGITLIIAPVAWLVVRGRASDAVAGTAGEEIIVEAAAP
jgi:drug/metabolite transporter (DMT)-like permease